MADACHNCRFWGGQSGGEAYSCLRYPPEMEAGKAYWPQTWPTDWCGEHQKASTPEHEHGPDCIPLNQATQDQIAHGLLYQASLREERLRKRIETLEWLIREHEWQVHPVPPPASYIPEVGKDWWDQYCPECLLPKKDRKHETDCRWGQAAENVRTRFPGYRDQDEEAPDA